ncbi:ABC transporter ATP-binding protein [Mangrovibrevibacter kandeliae]|uniref:ABC transporter ATP-binding protein n=1 Tax=Mangrovibrevibacter kandeliae TaxID=2968473 RepID=UPI002118D0AB|nr:ABC transporter ATP-binding protein [Aurantimonas sp. CSK15Z-1]MCQ8783090.1 ABC transporter ATP-binding protein [Aurantimonas sp. CSK15Z-1]
MGMATGQAEAVTSRGGAAAPPALLTVENLQTFFRTSGGTVRAVDGVSFDLAAGASLGIVGESGSGKSVTSLSIMRLIDRPGFIAGGRILFKGRDLVELPERDVRRIRGGEISLVFQDPMAALNPVYTVGSQVVEAILAHRPIGRKQAMERAIELFRMVGIPAPEVRVNEYPHKLSGGMRQRVTIALALANEPDLLILDEPTTALDVTVQAQILDLVRDLQQRVDTAVLLITHDIGVVREVCEEVIVMYGGRVMERGSVAKLTDDPKHPYTVGLLGSMPQPGMKGRPLQAIPGAVPAPLAMPQGCPFQSRCPHMMEVCTAMPPLKDPGDGRLVACWLYEGGATP